MALIGESRIVSLHKANKNAGPFEGAGMFFVGNFFQLE